MHQQTDSAAEVSSLVKVVANGKLPLTSYDNILWIGHRIIPLKCQSSLSQQKNPFKLKKVLKNMRVCLFS